MKKLIVPLIVVALLATLFPATVSAGYTISARLLAGQTEFAGVVRVTGDANLLTIEFALRGGEGWCMNESQVHVATSLDDFPQNKGGAIPGQFDYKTDHDCVTGFTYQIPVQTGWHGNQIFVAAHAVVIGPDGQEETGWAVNCGNLEGGQFPGRNWSAFTVYPANGWN